MTTAIKTTTNTKRKALTPGLARALAVKASVDPRTIQRIYAGLEVRGLAADRARKVLRDAGLIK